jgi:hypothetical protein
MSIVAGGGGGGRNSRRIRSLEDPKLSDGQVS